MERSAVPFMYINKLYNNYVDNDKNKELDNLNKEGRDSLTGCL